MPRVAPAQFNFNGGEVSPAAQGRADEAFYKRSLALVENYVPQIQGSILRRSGTYYVQGVKSQSLKTILVSFRFSTTQAYILEFGNEYIRVFKDHSAVTLTATNVTGITQASPPVITSNAHGLSNGDRFYLASAGGMIEMNNKEFTAANITANTVEAAGITSTGYGAYTSGGTIAKLYQVASPYLTADLFQLKFSQSADTLYITHPSYQQRKLTRSAHTSWTLTAIDTDDGPYLPVNTTAVTLAPSATSGATTVIASAATFVTTDVGRVIRIKHGSTWGWCRITAFANSTQVNVQIYGNGFGATTASTTWRLGLWSTTTGFPSCSVFHEDRLFLAGSTAAPQRIDGSNSGDYENFSPSDGSGTVAANNAVSLTVGFGEVNVIRSLISDEKALLACTTGGEILIRASSQGEALTPTNIAAKPSTTYGCADIQPVQIGKSVIFAQNSKRTLRELLYFYDVDGFRAPNATIVADHVLKTGVTQMAYTKEPQSIVWMCRTDGQLVGMTYERDIDTLIIGFHRHVIGGASDAAGSDAIVESVAAIPSPDGSCTELWMIVKRYINGDTVRYVEYMKVNFDDAVDQQDGFFVDAGLTYDSPITMSGATAANPVVITATSHGLSNADFVLINEVKGMTNINGKRYKIANKTANTFELTDENGNNINGTAFTAYVSGGEVRKLVSSISGYNHLIGQAVDVCVDGSVQNATISSSGVLALDPPGAVVHTGKNYKSRLKMLPLDAGAADGTALGKTKRTNRVGIMLYRSLGLKLGTDFVTMQRLEFRNTRDPMTGMVPLYSGVLSEEFEADYDFYNQICVEQDKPLPSHITAILPQMVVQDRG